MDKDPEKGVGFKSSSRNKGIQANAGFLNIAESLLRNGRFSIELLGGSMLGEDAKTNGCSKGEKAAATAEVAMDGKKNFHHFTSFFISIKQA